MVLESVLEGVFVVECMRKVIEVRVQHSEQVSCAPRHRPYSHVSH